MAHRETPKTGPNRTGNRNEGEGSRTAARAYNKDQQEFVKSGEVDKAAQEAKRAYEGKEREELEKAEKEGRAHSREVDPNVKRDYKHGEH